MRRLPVLAVTGMVAVGLTLSACGSDTLTPTTPAQPSAPGTGGTSAGGGVDDALAAKVPA